MDRDDYTSGAKSLHWLIALLILVLFPLGWVMGDFSGSQKAQAFNLHKSLGITVLALMALRMIWRGYNGAPELPSAMPKLERIAAKLGHFALYALLFALPLTGWAMTSTSSRPSLLFGHMDFPLLPWLSDLTGETRKSYHEIFEDAHSVIAYVLFSSLRRTSRRRSATPSCSRRSLLPHAAPLWPGSRAVICPVDRETLRKRPRNPNRSRPFA